MTDETEKLVAAIYHGFRAEAKAEKRGRGKGPAKIKAALQRRYDGEVRTPASWGDQRKPD